MAAPSIANVDAHHARGTARFSLHAAGTHPRATSIREFFGVNGPSGTGSPLESDFLRLFHRLKVPIPVAQYGVPPFGEAWYWLDFAYPDLKVAIEIDSEEWHFGDHEVFEADRARWNQLLCWGWRPITFTSRAKHDPGYVDRTVREVLKAAETQRPCAPGQCRRLLVGEGQ
jgi:hypothetical protein